MCSSQVLVSFNINTRDLSESQNLKETGSLPMSVNFNVRLGVLFNTVFVSSTALNICQWEDMQVYTLHSLIASGGLLKCYFCVCVCVCVWGWLVSNVVLYGEGWQIECWRSGWKVFILLFSLVSWEMLFETLKNNLCRKVQLKQTDGFSMNCMLQ